MKNYPPPSIEREAQQSFYGIPDKDYESTVNTIECELRRAMRQNAIKEADSIRFASGFVTTPPFEEV